MKTNIKAQDYCCPNSECVAHGHYNKGNVIGHHLKKGRLKCKECNKTFSIRKGTPLYRRKVADNQIMIVLLLIFYGCPIHAIEKVFRYRYETICSWIYDFGDHFESLHHHYISKPRDHKRIEADELWSKRQGGKFWVTSALASISRLWLGGNVSQKRNQNLIFKLCHQIAQCTIAGKELLIVTDGLRSYITGIKKYFRQKIPRKGHTGRSSYQIPEQLVLIQCVKSYSLKGKRYICHGVHHCLLAIGSYSLAGKLYRKTQHQGVIHTAYIERFNATLRSSIHALTRRGRTSVQKEVLLEKWLYFTGTIYNFVRVHKSLNTTPAIKAGIVNQVFTIEELTLMRRPIKKWTPQKKRGRPSKQEREMAQKWAS